MQNKKLILFIHGLGGSDETWGDFLKLIGEDASFSNCDVVSYTYDTTLLLPRSVASLSGKVISMIFPQSVAARLLALGSVALPQNKLPKIQHIADELQTKIKNYYGEYEDIYLITHSMGGLVARKYLHRLIKECIHSKPSDVPMQKYPLQIKKLMLYAVPNNGSKWAKLEALYSHVQIAQLDEESDFLETLNEEMADVNLDEYIDVCYVIGNKDQVVTRASAKLYHANKHVDYLPYGHRDIVKPTAHTDDSYMSFKHFIDNHVAEENIVKIPQVSKEATSTPFSRKIIKSLFKRQIVTLFSQDFVQISTQQNQLKAHLKAAFHPHFYHLYIPQNIDDEAAYISSLTEDCHFDASITSITAWERALAQRLEGDVSAKVVLFLTGVEDAKGDLTLILAQTLRRLCDEHPNLFVVVVGKKKLAALVEGKDAVLSPFNTSEKFFFESKKSALSSQQIRQAFQNLKADAKEICPYLEDEVKVKWAFYHDSILHTLFWKSLMVEKDGFYVWRDELSKEIGREVFGCEGNELCI